MDKFADMLDQLIDAYPELQKDASALKDKLAAQESDADFEMEEGDFDAELPEEEPVMPGAFKPIPKELQDEDEEEEEDERAQHPTNISGSY
jgi:hypothetical protein